MNTGKKYTKSLVNSRDLELVGGKGASLGRLIRAGFHVPGGFVVTTQAYRAAYTPLPEPGTTAEVPAEVAAEIRARYAVMGGGAVAVRSSATAEDMAAASMAGQCETFLDIQGEDALVDAVRKCWASLHTPRIRAYLLEHEVDPEFVAMAVVVQRLVPAYVAGVLFTADPNGSGAREMIVDANWGLGETVVGGHVQPDVLRLDAENGRVLSASIADKTVYLAAGGVGEKPVEETRRKQAYLSSRDVFELWQLGRRAESHFGAPQDIEWAIHEGKLYLLQSRPITTQRESGRQQEILQATRQRLRSELAAQRGPWVLHNLAETLPHPTTLTWSVIKRFMSGSGGFGAMYRRAGFQPSAQVEHEGFLELIAGRIYMDAARAPEMFCADFPFAYDLEKLIRDPEASQKPPSIPRGSFSVRMKAARILGGASAMIETLAAGADAEFRAKTAPAIEAYVAQARALKLSQVSTEGLIALWQEREKQVMDEFGPQTMLPSLICGAVWADLETFLAENFWDEPADALLRRISAGGQPDRTVIADAELFEVAAKSRSLDSWLTAHGHRGPGEFDLLNPRWRDQKDSLREMAGRLAAGEPPLERFARGHDAAAREADKLRAQLPAAEAREFDRRLERVRRFLPFREEGKDYLMLAYQLLRDVAVEMGRRLEIGDGVFHLTREEMFDAVRVGFAPLHLIEQRQLTYRAEFKLNLPRVIDATALERLGAPAEAVPVAGGHAAMAISSGRAAGPARVLHSAVGAGDLGTGYILVCPSTDPAWTPLFVNAAGLVLERGGTLSHGAVVAREMGVPAVVLADATRIFRDGEAIAVDGNRGWVGQLRLETSAGFATATALAEADPADTRIPTDLIPPPPGSKDRRASKVRNVALGFWLLYLAAFFLLPSAMVREPSLALLDFLLWPLVNALGQPAVVAIVAAIIGIGALVVQKLATNNRALLVAKRRAAVLTKTARTLPKNSPRRKAMLAVALPVNGRLLHAGLVPICLLLGPLMLPFVWFSARLDPAVPQAAAGATVQVVAMVDGDWTMAVRLEVPESFQLDETTPIARTLLPLRPTLERLLALYRQPATPNANGPWEFQLAPDLGRVHAATDLKNYLDAGLPPRGMTWTLRSPADANGRFPVSIVTDGSSPLGVDVVLGSRLPPAPASVVGEAGSPLRELRVVYPRPAQKSVFWQPFARFETSGQGGFLHGLSSWDTGWLWLYILVYVPVLFLFRAVLKVA